MIRVIYAVEINSFEEFEANLRGAVLNGYKEGCLPTIFKIDDALAFNSEELMKSLREKIDFDHELTETIIICRSYLSFFLLCRTLEEIRIDQSTKHGLGIRRLQYVVNKVRYALAYYDYENNYFPVKVDGYILEKVDSVEFPLKQFYSRFVVLKFSDKVEPITFDKSCKEFQKLFSLKEKEERSRDELPISNRRVTC